MQRDRDSKNQWRAIMSPRQLQHNKTLEIWSKNTSGFLNLRCNANLLQSCSILVFWGVVTVGEGLEQNWITLKWEFGVGNLCGLCVTAVCHSNKSHIHRHESYTSTQFIQHSVLHYDSLSLWQNMVSCKTENMLINVFSANNFTPS